MSTQYKMQEATFNLPDSNYLDTTVNVFKHNGAYEHSFVVTRSERDSNLSLEEELNQNLKKIENFGSHFIQPIQIQNERWVNKIDKNGQCVPVKAALADYGFELQGKNHYQQQLVTEVKVNGEVKNMLVFTYTQSTPIGFGDDSVRLLEVWDSIILSDD